MSLLQPLARTARAAGIDTRRLYQAISAASLRSALREQGLDELVNQLRAISPDISDQYSHDYDASEFSRLWEIKMRGMHAFQVQATLDVLDIIGGQGLTIADVGDSSGNHGRYLKALSQPGQIDRVISVNLDPIAVDKIKSKGGDAILCRAEELDHQSIRPDLIISFETLEHFTDPIRFLHSLATKSSSEYILVTVPLRRDSRFGDDVLRHSESMMPTRMTAERVHIFELCPTDWRLLARFAGFKTVFEKHYRQYPLKSPMRLTKTLWRRLDFEGFLALLLRRDLSVANRYVDW